jgi:hypothetical protein
MSPAVAKQAVVTNRKITRVITQDLENHLRYTVAPSKARL